MIKVFYSALLFLLFLLLSQLGYTQNLFPNNYYQSPIAIPLKVAGNFGELRPFHFHAGVDLKTNNKTGLSVHAVSDGYISRVKVSSFGYGKVIYITHSNGTVSVYAHLSAFNKELELYVRQTQYERKSFDVDLVLDRNKFIVKKNDIIAFSGNTGNSFGPHLHFEIRNATTEKAINPLWARLPILDTLAPTFSKIYIFPATKSSSINGKNHQYIVQLIGGEQKIKISGDVYIGIEAFDQETMGGGKNGVYSTSILVNEKCIYQTQMDSIGFDETLAVNSLIDYSIYKKSHVYIQRSLIEPNNKLGVYKVKLGSGVLHSHSDSIYKVKIILKDFFGHSRTASFKLIATSDFKKQATIATNCTATFSFDKPNNFSTTNFNLSLPPYALFDNLCFDFSLSNTRTYGFHTSAVYRLYSPIYHLNKNEVALYKNGTLSIQPDSLPLVNKKQLFIAIASHGQLDYVGSEWEGNKLKTSIREFGDYCVSIDTVSPNITPLVKQGQTITNQTKVIGFTVKDNLTGIGSFNALLDGKWALMEYEYKQHLLYYTINAPGSEKLTSGLHNLQVTVYDKVGNERTYKLMFKKN